MSDMSEFSDEKEVRAVPVEQILLGERIRRMDEAHVASMMKSITQYGLLQPIGVTTSNVLVYGFHRLEAHRRLGLATIMATIQDEADSNAELARDMEFAENDVRADMTWSEKADYFMKVREVETDRAKERVAQGSALGAARRSGADSEALPVAGAQQAGLVRDIVSARTGINHRSVEKVMFIKAAIDDDDLPEGVREQAAKALETADQTGKLDGQFQAVKRIVEQAKVPAQEVSASAHDAALSKKFVELVSHFEEALTMYDEQTLARVLDPLAVEGFGSLARRINTMYSVIGEARSAQR